MKKFFGDMRAFSTYILIFGVLLAYSMFKRHGIFSTMFNKDLTFVFWMILTGFIGFILGFIINTFFVGVFFEKLRGSINSLTVSCIVCILIYNINLNPQVSVLIKCLLSLIVTISFYVTFRELKLNENILFEVFIKSLASFLITVEFYSLFDCFYGKNLAMVFWCGYGVTQFFLVLSILRYIPNRVFENFPRNLIWKYGIGCFIYIYLKFIRNRLASSNFIYIIEWIIVCVAFIIYFYNLLKDLKSMSYKSYEAIWGKHRQTKILIRNQEFSCLSSYIDLFVEKGEKMSLIEFLFNQLYKLQIYGDEAKIIMYNLVEYRENDLPKYSSRYRLEYLNSQAKNARFLVAKYTIEKLDRVMKRR